MRPSEFPAGGQTQKLTDPFGNLIKPPMKAVGSFFLPWVREVIRDEEVAVIFLKEFWSQIVGDQLAKSTAPLQLRKRALEIGVPNRGWEMALQEMTKPLMVKVNSFWNRSLVYRLVFQVVDPWPGDGSEASSTSEH